jgi:hypothetical protein
MNESHDGTAEPGRFEYLRPIAAYYGSDEVQVRRSLELILAELSAEDLAALSKAYHEIERRGDGEALSQFALNSSGQDRRPFLMLLFLFSALARQGTHPFCDGAIKLESTAPTLNWSKLAAQIGYLAGPAEKYCKYQFDEEVSEFLANMSAQERQELSEVADRLSQHWDAVDLFLKQFQMAEHPEAAHIHFLGHLIALLHDADSG